MYGGRRESGGTAIPYSMRGLTLRFVLLTGMAIGLVGISALIQELQAASTAWIMGQSHWSRGQQQATHALSRYITSADPADLALTRQELRVPLGDLIARRALEQAAPDIAAARRGFIEGGNARGDINRLILSYRYLRDQPYFRDAVRLWRDTDDDLLQLVAITDRVQAGHAAGSLTPAVQQALLRRVQALDVDMQNQARAFSSALLHTAAMVRMTTFIVGGLSVLAITLIAVLLARRVRNDLTEQESRFRAAFYQATVGMLKLDEEGGIMETNQAMADILDHRREALLSLSLADLLVEGELVLDERGRIDWPRQLRPGELRFLRADGSLMWGRWSGTVVHTRGRAPAVFALVEDVSQNHALAREVEHHASHDPLTGLINRREIERLLDQALWRYAPRAGSTRCATSIWITSSWSTTGSAMPRATSCCAVSPITWSAPCAMATGWAAWAGTSLPCSWPTPARTRPSRCCNG